jgi:hypothetical protein
VALNDTDLLLSLGRIQFATANFMDMANGQVAERDAIGKAYTCPGRLWLQVQARGIHNIAAGNLPRFQLTILSDE